MCSIDLIFSSDSPDMTCALASNLSKLLKPGDVVLLSGNVGAGKTHFARCVIQASLIQHEDVPSPTYTLVQTYQAQTGEIWHSDLYRLSDLSEIEELGLLQAFSDAICLVEWPDRLGECAPPSALYVTLEPDPSEDARIIRMTSSDASWAHRLKGLSHV